MSMTAIAQLRYQVLRDDISREQRAGFLRQLEQLVVENERWRAQGQGLSTALRATPV